MGRTHDAPAEALGDPVASAAEPELPVDALGAWDVVVVCLQPVASIAKQATPAISQPEVCRLRARMGTTLDREIRHPLGRDLQA